MSVPILNMNDPSSMTKGKRPTLLPEPLTKLARAALIYPVRFERSKATVPVEFSPMLYAFNRLVVIAAMICGYGSLLGELMSFRKGQSAPFMNGIVAVGACFNYTLLVLPCTIAVFGSASRHAAWLDVMRLMDRVDEALDSRSCAVVDKRVERCVVWLVWLQSVVFAGDYCLWLTFNPSNKSYGVIYLFYYINMVSVAVYAQWAWCIGRRFDIVNREIEAKLERLTSPNRVEFANRRCHNLSYLLRCSDNRLKDVKYIPIKKIQEMHWSLCYCVNILNHEYGWQLLTSLLVNIINLITFSNILLTTEGAKTFWLGLFNYAFTIIYVGWLFCHLALIFLIVLPSSYANSKADRTAVSICKYLNVYIVPEDMKQVIGTTITYLLIFIQLQKK